MKRAVPLVLDTLHFLALAIWLGGLTLLLFTVPFIAPYLLKEGAGSAEILEAARLQSIAAALILFEICGMAMVGVQFLLRRRYRHDRNLFVADGLRHLLTFGAFFLTEYARYQLLPKMTGLLAAAERAPADGTYLVFAALQVLLLTGIGALTVWIHSLHSAGAVPVPASAPPAPPAKGKPSRSSRRSTGR